jgi:hypothetical protein
LADKKETLKSIIRSLHEGTTVEEAKRRFAEEVGSVGTAELVDIEQSLIQEGLTPEEVTRFCNVHVQLVQDALQSGEDSDAEPPAVASLRAENGVIRGLTTKVRNMVARQDEGRPLNEILTEIEDELRELRGIAHHYSLKENILFPYLEEHGFTGPSQVMWEKDNEIRRMLRSVLENIRGVETRDGWSRFADQELAPLLDEVDGMVDKEEDILFPAALQRFTDEEWAQASIALEESGASFDELVSEGDGGSAGDRVSPTQEAPAAGAQSAASAESLPDGTIQMPSGRLPIRELIPMLNTLPIDITYVDADDRVAFFTEGKKRVFMRPRSVIGRKVQNCHPPKSLHMVQQIVSAFKEGTSDEEDFWLEIEGRMIYIRYFAVRSEHGEYLGAMEVTQDITDIQKLTGEKRLLG